MIRNLKNRNKTLREISKVESNWLKTWLIVTSRLHNKHEWMDWAAVGTATVCTG